MKIIWRKRMVARCNTELWVSLGGAAKPNVMAAYIRRRGELPAITVYYHRYNYQQAREALARVLADTINLVLRPGRNIPGWAFYGADSLPGGSARRQKLFEHWVQVMSGPAGAELEPEPDRFEEREERHWHSAHFPFEEEQGPEPEPEEVQDIAQDIAKFSLQQMERVVGAALHGSVPPDWHPQLDAVLRLLWATGSQWPSEPPAVGGGISPLFLVWRSGRRERWQKLRQKDHVSYEEWMTEDLEEVVEEEDNPQLDALRAVLFLEGIDILPQDPQEIEALAQEIGPRVKEVYQSLFAS